MLFAGQEIWAKENVEELYERFNQNLQEGEGSFEEKFRQQLGADNLNVIKLAAEIVGLHFLFPSNLTGGWKRKVMGDVLGWAGETLDPESSLSRAMEDGIGSGGPGWHLRRWAHLAYFIAFVRRFKNEDEPRQKELVDDPWGFEAWLDSDASQEEQMRHVLLHLLFPDTFERIASTRDKLEIRKTFGGLVAELSEDIDLALWEIRQKIQELLPSREIDFYIPPLGECWDRAEEDEEDPLLAGVTALGALEFKRQVVLFGPPGTGKTFGAKELARRLIRHQALVRWKPVRYLENEDLIEKAIETQVRRLQLHPAYSYEDFIRGLHFEGGETKPRDGYLLELMGDMDQTDPPTAMAAQGSDGGSSDQREEAHEPLERLPWVLILDEINRVDLSRLFGEAFSALEDRGTEIELPIQGDGLRRALKIPKDLFVIGTMNLIDQSVEQLDFALRRRFLWLQHGFRREVIPAVVEQQWSATDLERFPWVRRYGWADISADIDRLAAQADRLNEEISKSRWLGPQYEVGHTYFFDVVGFLRRWPRLHSRGGQKPSGYLWDARDRAQAPLNDLWAHALRPLLAEYLAGIDSNQRESELTRLEQVFFDRG